MAEKNDQPALTDAQKAERRAKNAANRARREAQAALKPARGKKAEAPPAAEAALQAGGPAPKAAPRKRASRKTTSTKAAAPKARSTKAAATKAPAKRTTSAKVKPSAKTQAAPFNILAIVQAGRLEKEALLLTASLRANSPDWQGRLILAEPQPEGAWAGHETRISDAARAVLTDLGAEITPFVAQHFGASYPYGNKIEALHALPPAESFIFFDTDTLFLGPVDSLKVDFTRPTASMRREGTWPEPPLYGPGYNGIWGALYDRFGLDFKSSLDLSQPDEHWERYLYFNAGWFLGADPQSFGARFSDYARALRDDPGEALAAQELDPWLDQAVLPLVIHSFGGGRPGPELEGLDGAITCHYRNLPLLYARESDRAVEVLESVASDPRIKPLMRDWEPARKLIYQGKGRDKLRCAFDRDTLPSREAAIRQSIRKLGWWLV